jgi:hypothetical protein
MIKSFCNILRIIEFKTLTSRNVHDEKILVHVMHNYLNKKHHRLEPMREMKLGTTL